MQDHHHMSTNDNYPDTGWAALNGDPVTEAHVRVCRERGHATHTVDGMDTGTCPRCGDVTSDVTEDPRAIDPELDGDVPPMGVVRVGAPGFDLDAGPSLPLDPEFDQPVTALDIQQALIELFETDEEIPLDDGTRFLYVESWQTFADYGVRTTNPGVVLETADGSQFQVTVVQTRQGEDNESHHGSARPLHDEGDYRCHICGYGSDHAEDCPLYGRGDDR